VRIGLNIFRLALVVAWVVLFWVSFQAVSRMGFGAAGDVFIGDFAQPWRAQFNADFAVHLLLVGAWLVFRARTWWLGLIWALLAINLGGVFTLAYLLVVSIQTEGDMRQLLLGRHAAVQSPASP
jgi:hypothetical protein